MRKTQKFPSLMPEDRKAPSMRGNKSFFAVVLLLCLAAPQMALAAPWDGPIQLFIDLLTGTTARLFAILAIIVLGFLSMSGRMSWGLGGSIVGGIVLVFGSAWLADAFIGSV